jgi:hypothetical protein
MNMTTLAARRRSTAQAEAHLQLQTLTHPQTALVAVIGLATLQIPGMTRAGTAMTMQLLAGRVAAMAGATAVAVETATGLGAEAATAVTTTPAGTATALVLPAAID